MAQVARFARLVLGWNVAVILWGAFVRATGSGAGCGAHWPLCNGEVVPRAPALETMIEFTHRATSGVALLLVFALCLWVFREKPKGHPARRAAAASVFFILTEAAVGAGLVLFRLVGENDSVARALFMAGHLANTFVLLACLTLTAHWCATDAPPAARGGVALRLGVRGLGAIALVGVGKSGAVAALGDTLYPAQSVLGGLAQDVSPTAHFLVQLRIAHPILALAGALLVAFAASRVLQATDDAGARSAAWAVSAPRPAAARRRAAERGAAGAGLDADRPPAPGRPALDRVRAAGRARAVAAPAGPVQGRPAPGDGGLGRAGSGGLRRQVDRHRLDPPDVPAVVGDRAVGGEEAHPRRVQDRHPRPALGVEVGPLHLRLALDVRAEVGEEQPGVVAEERVHDGPEERGVAAREGAVGEGVDHRRAGPGRSRRAPAAGSPRPGAGGSPRR